MRLVEMVCDVTLELGQDQWGAFCALYTESTRYKQIQKASTYTPFVSNWVFDLNLVQFCTVLQLNQERIANGALFRVVVLHAKALVFDTTNLATQLVDPRIGCRFVGAAPLLA